MTRKDHLNLRLSTPVQSTSSPRVSALALAQLVALLMQVSGVQPVLATGESSTLGLKAKPIKLESMIPSLDTGTNKNTLQADIQKDVYNPEFVPIPTSGWKFDYSLGRKLFARGDYHRALTAFQLALNEADGFDDNDPRVAMTKKAVALAQQFLSQRGRLGYDTNNKERTALTGRVTKVFPPSLAWLSGLRKGDRILKATVEGSTFKLLVKRSKKLRTIRLNLRKEKAIAGSHSLRTTASKSAPLATGVRKAKLFPHSEKILADYDCVLLVDCSGSMASHMAPGTGFYTFTRWQWCGSQSIDFYGSSNKYLKDGITIVPFNFAFSIKDHAGLNEISDLFDRIKPFGQTDIASPLSYVINRYLSRKASPRAAIKPLSITILTDGIAHYAHLRQVIINATRSISNKQEIVINFLEVDEANEGQEILDALDNHLVDAGARYDIVHVHNFQDLLRMGLKRAIVSTLISAQEQ